MSAKEKKISFETVAMAEILLGQDMVTEARQIVVQLAKRFGDDPKIIALQNRLEERDAQGEMAQIPVPPKNTDMVDLSISEGALRVTWEFSDASMGVAKRHVRYSGHSIVRLFTAAMGPRGVRKTFRDVAVKHNAAQLDLFGVPRPAVHVAAIGFLGRNGAFVPIARSNSKVRSQ